MLDFAEFFCETPWEQTNQLPELSELRSDDVSLLLFTSGTTGAPKGVAHSHNTLYAGAIAMPNRWGWGADTVTSIPHPVPATALTVAAALGPAKVPAIRAALKGRLINGLITDEATAKALLAR